MGLHWWAGKETVLMGLALAGLLGKGICDDFMSLSHSLLLHGLCYASGWVHEHKEESGCIPCFIMDSSRRISSNNITGQHGGHDGEAAYAREPTYV